MASERMLDDRGVNVTKVDCGPWMLVPQRGRRPKVTNQVIGQKSGNTEVMNFNSQSLRGVKEALSTGSRFGVLENEGITTPIADVQVDLVDVVQLKIDQWTGLDKQVLADISNTSSSKKAGNLILDQPKPPDPGLKSAGRDLIISRRVNPINHKEDCCHVMRDCVMAHKVWNYLLPTDLKVTSFGLDFKDWLFLNISIDRLWGRLDIPWPSVFVIVCWRLRN
ncbi:reverse transcriptase [Quillaja saponaria]|uniref:Reverse transcriptase n=1 Tax=Quillaja saponaria TaxID=32244 RepID=A0AAD7KWI4_QUISA|nr:reverse transcriptase [Quillaja saponaria]